MRSSAKNGLHLASMVFCSSLQDRVLGILVHIFDSVVQDFDKANTENKTPWSAPHHNVLRAEGEHVQSIMRSVCGQMEMGKLLEDMGVHTIARGIVLASKVEEDRRLAQLVSILCVSVFGEITGWEFRWSLPGYFYMLVAEDAAARQRGLSTIKQWLELSHASF